MRKALYTIMSSMLIASGLVVVGTDAHASPLDPSMSACPNIFSPSIMAEGAPDPVSSISS